MRDWGTAAAEPIKQATPAALREMMFAPGSMGPKIEAGCRFVERTGGEGAKGAPRRTGGGPDPRSRSPEPLTADLPQLCGLSRSEPRTTAEPRRRPAQITGVMT